MVELGLLEGLAAIKMHHLLPQIIILQLKQLYFPFKIENDLFFRLHLNNWFIFDIHSPGGVIESGEGLFCIDLGGTAASDHECFGGTSKGVLQQHSQLRVSIWYILLIKFIRILR